VTHSSCQTTTGSGGGRTGSGTERCMRPACRKGGKQLLLAVKEVCILVQQRQQQQAGLNGCGAGSGQQVLLQRQRAYWELVLSAVVADAGRQCCVRLGSCWVGSCSCCSVVAQVMARLLAESGVRDVLKTQSVLGCLCSPSMLVWSGADVRGC
jgi:hypothetical protein